MVSNHVKDGEDEVKDTRPPNPSITTASQAFSAILKSIGDGGSWQRRFMLLTSFCGVFTSFHNFGAAFLAATPEHWCNIPTLNASKTFSKEFQNFTVPKVRDKDGNLAYSSCHYYNYNYSEIENVSALFSVIDDQGPVEELPCTSWFYDDSVHSSTVVTEWNLVCRKKWLMSTTQASYMMGILTGAVIFSALSDRLGRKKVTMICVGLFIVASILTSFSVSLWMFLFLRFITAASGQGIYLINYIILMECSGQRARSILGSFYHLLFGFGLSFLPLLAYIWRDWRTLQLVCSIPICILLLYFWVLPESPRWLLMHKRFDEGILVLGRIADYNGKSLPPEEQLNSYLDIILKEIKREVPLTASQKISRSFEDIMSLVKTPNMRRRNLTIFYAWFVVSMLYFGLTFSSSNINASIYFTVFLAGVVEIPSVFMVAYGSTKHGRKVSLVAMMLMSGLACIAVVFVPKELVWVNLTLSTIGKLLVSAGFMLVFMISAELVPTEVRNTSIGIASMCARIGSGAAPYIVDLLGDIYYAIPFVIFGVLALLSGILCFMLPETGNRDLPESVEEIEKLPK